MNHPTPTTEPAMNPATCIDRPAFDYDAELPAARAWLRQAVIWEVADTYRRYVTARDFAREGGFRGPREPLLTVGIIAGDMGQGRIPHVFEWRAAHPGKHGRGAWTREVRAALESARKKGLLDASTGAGLSGLEARCYEPAGFYTGGVA